MGKLRNTFRKLIQGLYAIGAIAVGGTVGAIALGALAVYHAGYAVYRAYKKAEGYLWDAAKFLTLAFIPYPLGAAIYGIGHLGSAAYDVYNNGG